MSPAPEPPYPPGRPASPGFSARQPRALPAAPSAADGDDEAHPDGDYWSNRTTVPHTGEQDLGQFRQDSTGQGGSRQDGYQGGYPVSGPGYAGQQPGYQAQQGGYAGQRPPGRPADAAGYGGAP